MNKKLIIGIIALIGFLTTIELAVVYYQANFNPYAFSSFCSVNEFIDCDGVAKTIDSQFLGVPLAWWGMFLYLFIGLLLFVDKLKEFKLLKFLEVFKNPLSYISALGIISFVISMTLFSISLFEIKKLCILCLFTYILNLVIALVATPWNDGGFVKVFKDSFLDFADALKKTVYLVAFIVVIFATSVGLYYTTTSYIFTPQVRAYENVLKYAQMKKNIYAVKGNILGDKDAKVVLDTYSDYECPICYAQNIMLHKVAQDLKGVKIIHHNLPLDTKCNKYLPQAFHQNSCMMARYSIAAENQGKYWDINSEFFEKKPQTEDAIWEIAKSLDLDMEKLKADANSAQTKNKLQKEIDDSFKLGINGTPAMILNGKVTIGIQPYSELKKMLIQAGATK